MFIGLVFLALKGVVLENSLLRVGLIPNIVQQSCLLTVTAKIGISSPEILSVLE